MAPVNIHMATVNSKNIGLQILPSWCTVSNCNPLTGNETKKDNKTAKSETIDFRELVLFNHDHVFPHLGGGNENSNSH